MEPRHSLVTSASWGGLNRVIREKPATGIIVSFEAIPTYPSRERAIVGLNARFPNSALVLMVKREGDPHTLFRLGKIGIRNLVFAPLDRRGNELTRTLAQALSRSPASRVSRLLGTFLSGRELKTANLAMDSIHQRWSAEDLAGEVGLTRPHLSECFKEVGLPSIGHFLLWAKLFYAGHWLEEPGRSGESVARQLKYSSGAAFRRALKLYTGATPTQVKEDGGLRFVVRQFFRRNRLPRPRSLLA
jgi:AraC-like DNA-binding protein